MRTSATARSPNSATPTVAEGLLTRSEGGHPEYELTEDALGLWPALHALGRWGDRRTTPDAPRRLYRHVGCGPLGDDGRTACWSRSCAEFPA